MRDSDCVGFLQWALPRLHMRWPGFRKVRRQVCKRLARRLRALDLPSLDAYRAHLTDHPQEWGELDACCRVTISRFYRDRRVFDVLGDEVLPELARAAVQRDDNALHIWSAGCGGGEEAYSLALLWDKRVSARCPHLDLKILATDLDEKSLQRAALACYSEGSLKDLPEAWRREAFEWREHLYCLRLRYRRIIEFLRQDLRETMPSGPFDAILCRNLVFTYFDAELQHQLLSRFQQRLRPGGVLVLGAHERLPEEAKGLRPWSGSVEIFRKTG